MKKRYGVTNASQLAWVKRKKVKTCLENHGVLHPQQAEHVRKLTVARNQEKYGVGNVSQVPRIQKKRERTMRRLYGASNVMHNPDMLDYTQQRALRVKTLELDGKTFNFMGYEDYFLRWLVQKGVPVSHISTCARHMPRIYYKKRANAKGDSKYTPDITFKRHRTTWVVEVKSTYTLGLLGNRDWFRNVKAKAIAASKVCNYRLIVVNDTKTKHVVLTDFTDFTMSSVRAKVTALLRHE